MGTGRVLRALTVTRAVAHRQVLDEDVLAARAPPLPEVQNVGTEAVVVCPPGCPLAIDFPSANKEDVAAHGRGSMLLKD